MPWNRWPPRDHALICLLGLNGLRVSETCALHIEDLGHHKGQRTAYLTRKGGKVQTVPDVPSHRLGRQHRHR